MYCKNDVVLLREGCIKYRKEFIECTDVDPFGCVTLAGCAMKVYKTLFLTKDTIALTPKNAYLNQYKAYSTPSIQWWNILKQPKRRRTSCIKSRRSQIRALSSGWVLRA